MNGYSRVSEVIILSCCILTVACTGKQEFTAAEPAQNVTRPCDEIDDYVGFLYVRGISRSNGSSWFTKTNRELVFAGMDWRSLDCGDRDFIDKTAMLDSIQCADARFMLRSSKFLGESFFSPVSSLESSAKKHVVYDDEWNQPIFAKMEDKFCISIRSSGPDQKRYTSDDIIYLIRGEFEYTKLLLECLGDGSPPTDCNSVDGITDGWNRPFQCRPEPGAIELRSSGFDGVFGTQDDPFKTIRTQLSNSTSVP